MTNIQTYRKLLPWFAKTKDGDTQLPTIVKSGLFQHDPYQIYDYCANGTTSSNGVLIQRFTPYRQQWIDLVALVKPYLPSEKDLPKRVYTVKKTEVNERKGLRWKTLHIWSNAPIEPPAVTYYQLDSLPEWISTNFDNIIIDVSAKFNTRIRTFIGVKITTHVPFNSYETYKYPGKTIQEVIEEQGTSFTGYPPSSWWETSEDLYNYDFYLTYFDIKPEWEEENTILTTSETVILPDYYYWRWTDYINLCPPIDSDNFENGYLSEFIPDLDTELTITYYVRLTKQNQWESEIIDKWLTKIRLRKGIKTAIRLPPIVLHSCQIICSSESIRNLFRDNLTKISSQLATPNLLFPDSIELTG